MYQRYGAAERSTHSNHDTYSQATKPQLWVSGGSCRPMNHWRHIEFTAWREPVCGAASRSRALCRGLRLARHRKRVRALFLRSCGTGSEPRGKGRKSKKSQNGNSGDDPVGHHHGLVRGGSGLTTGRRPILPPERAREEQKTAACLHGWRYGWRMRNRIIQAVAVSVSADPLWRNQDRSHKAHCVCHHIQYSAPCPDLTECSGHKQSHMTEHACDQE